MSYILEALRKSERERQLKQSPSLTSVVAEQPQARRQWVPWLVVAVLVVVNAGALIYFVAKRDAPAPAAAEDRTSAVPANAVEKRNALPLGEGRVRAEAPDDSMSPSPPPGAQAITPTPIPQGSGATERPSAIGERLNSTPLAPPVAIRQPTQPQPAVAVQPAEVPAPVKVEAPSVIPPVPQVVAVPPPVREPATERAQISPPPLAEEKPTRRKAPGENARGKPDEAEEPEGKSSYRINVLAFDPDPDERFAIINMTKYFKGDRLPDGAVVEDIEAGAVVLSRHGKRIRIAH